MARAAFLTIVASCSLSSWPATSTMVPPRASRPAAVRASSEAHYCMGGYLHRQQQHHHQQRRWCKAFAAAPLVVGAGSSGGWLDRGLGLRLFCCCREQQRDKKTGSRKLDVFAEEGNSEAMRRAEGLVSLIRSSQRARTGLGAGEGGVQTGCKEAAVPTVFFGAGERRGDLQEVEVELLKQGEAPGNGLASELPEVLRLQCVPSMLSGDVLVRACVGKNKGAKGPLSIVDCTAGYLHDSLRLAASGHDVTALERDPVVFSFVSACLDELRTSRDSGKLYAERVASKGGLVQLLCADSAAWLGERVSEGALYDVIYLDPMFPPKRRQSALPKKRMQWLREHLHTGSGDGEAEKTELEALLVLARKVGRKVVIKRADDGPKVGKPSSSIESSKLVRYDIYVGVSS